MTTTTITAEFIAWIRPGRGSWEAVGESGNRAVAQDLGIEEIQRRRWPHGDVVTLPKGQRPDVRPMRGRR